MQANRVLSALVASAVVTVAGSAMGTPVVYRDFQSDTPGQLPQPNDSNLLFPNPPSAGALQVVDASTTPADPFGGAGNQSLGWTSGTTAGAYYVMAGSSGDAVTTGTFSMKFYHNHAGSIGDPVTLITLGSFSSWGPSLSSEALEFAVDGANAIALNVFGTRIDLDPQHFVSVNTVHGIVIDFDTVTDTFTAKLDGVQLTANSGAMTVFPFLSASNGIYAVQILAPTSSRTGQVFIDDVSIDAIPEPGSLFAFLATVGCAILRRRD